MQVAAVVHKVLQSTVSPTLAWGQCLAEGVVLSTCF
jgi:hypothetical protein